MMIQSGVSQDDDLHSLEEAVHVDELVRILRGNQRLSASNFLES